MAKQTIILIKIFANAKAVWPCLSRSMVSKLKVENVLKPPQNPVMINNFNEGLSVILSANIPTANARTKQLIAFETKVATGKTKAKLFCMITEMPYLTMLPNPPPKKT